MFAPRHPPMMEEADDRRRRATSLVLAIAVHVLLLLVLLKLAPPLEERLPPPALKVIPLPPETADHAQTHTTKKSATRVAGGARAPVHAHAATAPAGQPVPSAPWTLNPALAGFDLSHVPTQEKGTQTAAADTGGSGAGVGPGDSETAGTGPGGETLYRADWYREPTDAQLAPYMPPSRHVTGWGEVACRTVAHWHVEDCQELGQSPPGSGLSRAVREAAWQFLVRPPRVGGKSLVGTWVRIRIDYSEAPAR